MSKFFYKIVLIFIMSMLSCTFFYACSQNENGNSLNSEIVLKELKPVTLNFYFFSDSEEKKDTRLVLDEIEKRCPLNIKLNFKWLSFKEYTEMMNSIESNNESIDAFYLTEPGVSSGYDFTDMARKGLLMDITDILPEVAPLIYSQYSKEDLKCACIDGKLMGIPSLYPMTYSSYAVVRKDLMEKYNIPEIKTFDDYNTYLKIIKDNVNNIIPGKMEVFSYELAGSFDYAVLDPTAGLVYKWNDTQMKIVPWESTEEFKIIASYVSLWNKKGYLGNDMGWSSTSDLVASGKLSSLITAPEVYMGESIESVTYMLNNMIKFNNLAGTKAEIEAYRLYPGQKIQMIHGPFGDGWTGGFIAFNAKSPNVKRALMFLDWIQQNQENYDLFMYGIKDKDYILKGEQIDVPEGTKSAESTYMGWSGRWAFQNINYERIPVGFVENAKEQRMKLIKKNSQYAPHNGFYIDYNHLLKDKYLVRIDQLFNNIYIPMIEGTFDYDDIDNIVGNMKDSISGSIISSVQKQLDDWIAKKDK